MARIFISIVAVVASFMLAESLVCNKCRYGLLTFCLSSSEETCATNTSLCFSGNVSFDSLSSIGIKSLGCHEPAGCNASTTGSLLGVNYTKTLSCCSTDRCNNGASSTKMTLTAVIGVAILASMWGSIM